MNSAILEISIVLVLLHGHRRRLRNLVFRLHLDKRPDQPEWLSHVNAGILKVKLATALIGISSIHLLKTFEAERMSDKVMMWQVVIHMAFVISALLLAYIDRLTTTVAYPKRREDGH